VLADVAAMWKSIVIRSSIEGNCPVVVVMLAGMFTTVSCEVTMQD
jgi:hypothetical protein